MSTFHLPPFNREHPKLWLEHIEYFFKLYDITTEEDKFQRTVVALPTDIFGDLGDILSTPSKEAPFSQLVQELTAIYEPSNQQRFQRLMRQDPLGDRKPSQLLKCMQQLAGSSMEEHFLREMFLERLPKNVREILVVQPKSVGLKELAQMADQVMEVGNAQPTANAISAVSKQSDVQQLTEMISALRLEVSEMKSMVENQRQSGSRTVYCSHNKQAAATHGYCRWHRRFGKKAHNCEKPCSFPGNDQARE